MVNKYTLTFEQRKHIYKINDTLAQHNPEIFPVLGEIESIWDGVVTVGVDKEDDVAILNAETQTILKAVHAYGINSAETVNVEVSKRRVRPKWSDRLHISKRFTDNKSPLSVIQGKVFRLQEFNKRIAFAVGTPFPEHAYISNVKDGVIVVIATNGGAATRLRFMERQILEAAKHVGVKNAQKINVRITPEVDESRPIPRKVRDMSERSAEVLRSTAEGIEDPKLKEALQRLSKHSVKPAK